MIDLADVRLSLEPADIHELVDDLRPDLLRPDIKIAVVSSTETREFDQLRVLSTALSSRGSRVVVFDDTKVAVAWLSERS